MSLERIKKLSINIMIISLVGAAIVAVVAVLAGDWNDVFSKALFTLLVVALHSLVALGFLETSNKLDSDSSLKFFTNSVFAIIVLSFFTSIFGVWEVLDGEVVAKLYGTYFIFLFATLHGQILHQTTGKESKIDLLVYANYLFMGLVILMLLPILWFSDADFGGFYYRLLSAAAIIDATLTILAVILHKLYIQKHPKTTSQLFAQIITTTDQNGNIVKQTAQQPVVKRRMHPLLVVLIVILILQFVVPALLFMLFSFS